MRVKRSRPILVRPAPGSASQARVALCHGVRPAALGRFPVRQVLYRPDRILRPRTQIPVHAIRRHDGWCDDPADRNYNRLIRLPSRRSAEGLKRPDHLYDLVLVLGYNDRPRVKGKGSAIFVHLARSGFSPTDGCIALTRHDLTMLLAQLKPGSELVVMR